jgi:peptidoglycan/LPS O-acetylase OafA/YrhL
VNPHSGGFYTAHLWTLAVEEHFYILWPLALVLVSVRFGQQLAIFGAIACALWRTLSFHFVPMLFGNAILLWRTDYRLDSLFWGCAFAYVLHDRTKLKYIVYGTVVYVACVGLNSPTQRLCMPIVLPFAMVITATRGEWWLSKLLDSSVMTWIAKISYSLYLWQMLFLVRGNNSDFPWQRFPANLVFTLLTATICYYVIDLPLQRTGRRLSRQFDANRRNIMRRCSAVV